MIEPHNDLSVRRQCELLNLARSGIYWEPMPMAEEDLAICKELDKLHLELPAFGSRKLSRLLKAQGQTVNRKRVQRLMRIMGIEALAPKPRTTVPAPEHTKFPVLAAPSRDHSAQSGVGLGYHVHPDETGALLPGRRDGLVHAPGSVLAHFKHDGQPFLHRGRGRSSCELRLAGDLQHRPGVAVYRRQLHIGFAGQGRKGQHGRSRPIHGQHLRSSVYGGLSNARRST